jgi:hypothetical protein
LKLITEQKKREGREDDITDDELKTIIVDKWMPWKDPGRDAKDQVIKTPDHGTFEEMFKRYGSTYRYFCAQFPVNHTREYPLFPDKEKGEEFLRKYPERIFGILYWDILERTKTPEELEQIIQNKLNGSDSHLDPLTKYGQNRAWIDLEHNVILVEHAR